jgi:hypothetical protein
LDGAACSTDVGDDGAKALGAKLCKAPQLSVLTLAHNRIGDAGLTALAKGIATTPSLTVQGRSCVPIARSSCPVSSFSAQELSLAFNRSGPTGASALAAALRSGGTSLRQVEGGRNAGQTALVAEPVAVAA